MKRASKGEPKETPGTSDFDDERRNTDFERNRASGVQARRGGEKGGERRLELDGVRCQKSAPIK